MPRSEPGQLEVSRVLIDLDSILDTRLSVINSQKTSVLEKAITDKYFERERDEFPGISFSEFEELYKARSKTSLKDTVITPMMFFLEQFVNKTLENITSSPFHMKPAIVINTYPYQLTADEDKQIINAVKSAIDNKADVGVVHLSPEQITVKYVKEYYSVVVMYRYDLWVTSQASLGNFNKLTCPEVTVIGPKLKFTQVEVDGKEDPFEKTEELLAPLVGLLLFPVRDFCAVTAID